MTTILTCAMAARGAYENRPSTIVGYHPFQYSGSRGYFGSNAIDPVKAHSIDVLAKALRADPIGTEHV